MLGVIKINYEVFIKILLLHDLTYLGLFMLVEIEEFANETNN